MNDNGYIRKIDELGRIVIPKELRNKLKIQDGENLIINYNDKKIQLSKYSYVINNENFIKKIGDAFNLMFNFNIIITDLEHIIYSSEKTSSLKIDHQLLNVINKKNNLNPKKIKVNEELLISEYHSIENIISYSTSIGLVIVYSDKDKNLSSYAKFIAYIISSHIEVT